MELESLLFVEWESSKHLIRFSIVNIVSRGDSSFSIDRFKIHSQSVEGRVLFSPFFTLQVTSGKHVRVMSTP